jgi:hypothetical protein
MQLFFRLFALLALASSLPARGATPDDTTPQQTVSVKFTVVGWSGDTPALAYKQGGTPKHLDIVPFARSKAYEYTGPAGMDLYTTEAGDKPTKVGSVLFPVGPKRFTVLIGGQPGHYVSRVIEDDESVFPTGSARVFNLTPTRMIVRYNQASTVVIPPGQHEILRPRADFQLVSETAFERRGKWQRSNDDFIYVPPDAQTSVFYFENDSSYFKSIDGGSRDVQLVSLVEKPAKEEAKEK